MDVELHQRMAHRGSAASSSLRSCTRRTHASLWNICTVSSENCSRSLPRLASFFSRSCVTVMTSQPMLSACTMLSTSRARPDELLVVVDAEHVQRTTHDRKWVDTGVGDAPGKDGHEARRPFGETARDPFDLRHGEQRGDVHLGAMSDEALQEDVGPLSLCVRDRDLDVDIGSPARDLECLTLHLDDVVGEDFEGDGSIGDNLEYLSGERLIVVDAGLAHERGIRGEARDHRVTSEAFNARAIGAVSEDLYVHALPPGLAACYGRGARNPAFGRSAPLQRTSRRPGGRGRDRAQGARPMWMPSCRAVQPGSCRSRLGACSDAAAVIR